MRDEAIQLAQQESDPAAAMNALREYLQALALRSLHEAEAFVGMVFVGGTALRFAHGLRRFSEDLDFSLDSNQGYEPTKWLKKLKYDLELAGLAASVAWNDRSTVHKAWLRWSGLLYDAGISPHADQKLSIKIEVDTRPPEGGARERQVVTRHRLLALQLYDLPSLMAGKLHATITRAYPKGRDWYDLMWYRGHRPTIEPNLVLLQNALDQTQGLGTYRADAWKDLCLDKLDSIRASQLADDVRPFLEDRRDADMLSRDNLVAALS